MPVLPFRIVAQTPDELVVVKPAGLSSEFKGDNDGVSLKSLVAKSFPGTEPKLPHRLDRITRGLLLVSLSQRSIVFHNEEIKAGRWEKYYLATVERSAGCDLSSFIGEHRAYLKEVKGRSRIVHAGGKPSFLRILGAFPVPGRPDRAHLVIRLLTGRFHQIRIMCADMGLPIPGDPIYDPKRRDLSEFYLEHAILIYRPLDAEKPVALFAENDPERGVLDEKCAQLLKEIAERALTAYSFDSALSEDTPD